MLSWTAFLSPPRLLVSEACEGHIQIRTGSESRKRLELHKTSRRPDCISAGWTLGIIVHFSSHFYSFQLWIASMAVLSSLHFCLTIVCFDTQWVEDRLMGWPETLLFEVFLEGRNQPPCNKEQTWNVLEHANWVLLLCWNQFIGLWKRGCPSTAGDKTRPL